MFLGFFFSTLSVIFSLRSLREDKWEHQVGGQQCLEVASAGIVGALRASVPLPFMELIVRLWIRLSEKVEPR